MRFTRKTLATLNLPDGKPYAIHWDEDLPGFGIRLNPTSKVWVVQYRAHGKTRRETIGPTNSISLEAARNSARDTLSRVRLGADPRAEKMATRSQNAVTFQVVANRYLKSAAERLKPRSLTEITRHLTKQWSNLSELPIKAIDRSVISIRIEELAEVSGPIAANRARASLSALYSFAISAGLCDINPVIGTVKPGHEITRDHVLAESDMIALWNACHPTDYGRILQLLLLTGQRREEVGGMLWSEVDLDKAIWVLPAQRTKNKRTHEVPLAPQCLAILRSAPRVLGRDNVFGNGERGFSGWSKAKLSLDARLSPQSSATWKLHDLRRTAATGMATLGVDPHIIEAVLNHISGTRAGVAGIYNRATYRNEKRAALSMWGTYVDGIVSACN